MRFGCRGGATHSEIVGILRDGAKSDLQVLLVLLQCLVGGLALVQGSDQVALSPAGLLLRVGQTTLGVRQSLLQRVASGLQFQRL